MRGLRRTTDAEEAKSCQRALLGLGSDSVAATAHCKEIGAATDSAGHVGAAGAIANDPVPATAHCKEFGAATGSAGHVGVAGAKSKGQRAKGSKGQRAKGKGQSGKGKGQRA